MQRASNLLRGRGTGTGKRSILIILRKNRGLSEKVGSKNGKSILQLINFVYWLHLRATTAKEVYNKVLVLLT